MPISSVGPSAYPPTGMSISADKAAPADKVAAPAASTASAPDKDDAKAPAEAKPESSSSASSAPNMFKINPDGTVGPMHARRHPNATSVVHA